MEEINQLYQPRYDMYDPQVMRQAAFQSSLMKLKPVLAQELAKRAKDASNFVQLYFDKYAKEAQFVPNAYTLACHGDLDSQGELTDPLLSL